MLCFDSQRSGFGQFGSLKIEYERKRNVVGDVLRNTKTIILYGFRVTETLASHVSRMLLTNMEQTTVCEMVCLKKCSRQFAGHTHDRQLNA